MNLDNKPKKQERFMESVYGFSEGKNENEHKELELVLTRTSWKKRKNVSLEDSLSHLIVATESLAYSLTYAVYEGRGRLL